MFEHTKHGWNCATQAAFVSGMEFAMDVLENRTKYDGLPEVNQPPKSNDYKSLSTMHFKMQAVDKYLDPLIKNGSINNIINN